MNSQNHKIFINNQSSTGGSRGIENSSGKQIVIINEKQNEYVNSNQINYQDVKIATEPLTPDEFKLKMK